MQFGLRFRLVQLACYSATCEGIVTKPTEGFGVKLSLDVSLQPRPRPSGLCDALPIPRAPLRSGWPVSLGVVSPAGLSLAEARILHCIFFVRSCNIIILLIIIIVIVIISIES